MCGVNLGCNLASYQDLLGCNPASHQARTVCLCCCTHATERFFDNQVVWAADVIVC
jgi:hypothetical protein